MSSRGAYTEAHRRGQTWPIVGGFAITPHDTNLLLQPPRALWIGGAGNLAVSFHDGQGDVTLVGVPAGTLLPMTVRLVKLTGTTATNILGLY